MRDNYLVQEVAHVGRLLVLGVVRVAEVAVFCLRNSSIARMLLKYRDYRARMMYLIIIHGYLYLANKITFVI